MGIEKRRGRRIRVRLPIRISYGGAHTITAETQNISPLGTYVEIGQQIPLGTDVDIILKILPYPGSFSSNQEVKCQGGIFRCNLVGEVESRKIYGIGVFFTDFQNPEEQNKLSRYIEFLTSKEANDIKAGAQLLQDKKKTEKKIKKAKEQMQDKTDYQKETLDLLKQILSRLDELHSLLQSQKSS